MTERARDYLTDTEVAEQVIGCNVRYLRAILDKTPGSYFKVGRQRRLWPNMVEIAKKAVEDETWGSNSSSQAKGKTTSSTSRRGRSRTLASREAWSEAQKLLTGGTQS